MLPNSGNGVGPGGRGSLCCLFSMNLLSVVMTTNETGNTARIAKGKSTEGAMASESERVDHPKNQMLL